MHSICKVLPSFQLGALLLTWLRDLHKCVLHPSSIPALREEEKRSEINFMRIHRDELICAQ